MADDTFELTPEILGDDLPSPEDELAGVTDGKGRCDKCGKVLTITKAGTLRGHKCVDGKVTTVSAGKVKGTRKRKGKTVPETVMRVGTAALAAGIETTTRNTVASYAGIDKSLVPADIPDADEMIGPLIRALWPAIPAKAQGAIESVCDQEDLIMCALAWFEYVKTMSAFARDAKAAVESQQRNVQSIGRMPNSVETSPSPEGNSSVVPQSPIPFQRQIRRF